MDPWEPPGPLWGQGVSQETPRVTFLRILMHFWPPFRVPGGALWGSFWRMFCETGLFSSIVGCIFSTSEKGAKMELPKGGWTCNPLTPAHVSWGSAVVDLAPFWAPFWEHFGSPSRHYTPFWSTWGANWMPRSMSKFRCDFKTSKNQKMEPKWLVPESGVPLSW